MTISPYLAHTHPRSIAHVLDSGVALYRKSFWTLLPLMILFGLFSYSPYFLSYAPPSLTPYVELIRHYNTVYWVIQAAIVSTLFIAIFYRLYAFLKNIPCDTGMAIGVALHKLLPFLGVLLLVGAVLVGSLIPTLFPKYAFHPFFWLISLVCGVGFLYLFPALILTSIRTTTTMGQNIETSFQLVKGHFIRTNAILGVTLLLYGAFSAGIAILFLGMLTYGTLTVERPDVAQMLVQMLTTIVFGAYIPASLLVLVHDLEARQNMC
jgi:hypothetical protein